MFQKAGLGILALLALGILIALFRGNQSAFSEEGAFEDEDANRIYTVVFDPSLSALEVREYAEALPFTDGRATAVYFYPDRSAVPRDGVSFASSVAQANEVIYESRGFGPWRFAFMRDPGQGIRFVDCVLTPGDGLCRKA